MIKLQSLGLPFVVRGMMAFAVRNPSACDDFSHLIGHDVKLNGELARVHGVERQAHAPPWKAGEIIGVVVSFHEPTDP